MFWNYFTLIGAGAVPAIISHNDSGAGDRAKRASNKIDYTW